MLVVCLRCEREVGFSAFENRTVSKRSLGLACLPLSGFLIAIRRSLIISQSKVLLATVDGGTCLQLGLCQSSQKRGFYGVFTQNRLQPQQRPYKPPAQVRRRRAIRANDYPEFQVRPAFRRQPAISAPDA